MGVPRPSADDVKLCPSDAGQLNKGGPALAPGPTPLWSKRRGVGSGRGLGGAASLVHKKTHASNENFARHFSPALDLPCLERRWSWQWRPGVRRP